MKSCYRRLLLPLLLGTALFASMAQADSEFWYLMTPADDLDKPMGFYHVKRSTDPESGDITDMMQQRARVNLFFFKIKVDETAVTTADASGLRSVAADIRRGGTTFAVAGERDGDALAMKVNDDAWTIPLASFEQTDLALVLPVDITRLQSAGTITTPTLLPEVEQPASFTTRYVGKKVVKMPRGKRELHILERDDSREQQTLWVDDAGVVQVLIGKRRALVMSDKETVQRWARDNP